MSPLLIHRPDKAGRRLVRFLPCLFILVLSIPLFPAPRPEDEDYRLKELLRLAENPPREYFPAETITRKGDILYCSGNLPAAVTNNKAADLMREGRFNEAVAVLEAGLVNAPLFFPFRYNLGLCYLNLFDLKSSLLHFEKAVLLVPEYSRTYLQIGYLHQRFNRESLAIQYFREALRRNAKELDTFILIGDIFFRRHQLEMAQKYYDTALRIDPLFPNGLLGRAKIYFIEGSYHRCIVLLKSIDTSREYDIALHYYWAEASFKLRDYETARIQYEMLLTHQTDRFFLTTSPALIKHKLEITQRFTNP